MRSLQSYLLFSYVVIIFVCLTLAGAAVFILLQGYRADALGATLTERALPAAVQARHWVLDGVSWDEIEARFAEQMEGLPARVLILDANSTVVVDSRRQLDGATLRLPSLPALKPADVKVMPTRGRFRTPTGELLLYGAASLRVGAADVPHAGWVVVAQPLRGGVTILQGLTQRLLFAGAIALILSVIVALLIAQSMVQPLRRVTAATEEMAKGNYDVRLDIESPDEVRRLSDSFNKMAEEVSASRQAQRDFLANVSHELRTPLTSIRGFAQAILDGTAREPAAQERAARIVYEESNRMIRMVEDLLDLAKIEAGQIVMERRPLDLKALAERAVAAFAPRAETAGVSLRSRADSPVTVSADADRLLQVLTNLLDNALRYTPAGGVVTVAVESVAETADGPALARLSVADSGPSIPPEEARRIFERFYQLDKSRARGKKGAGLGLAIAQQIVQAHGGRIYVESQPGQDTRFVVDLPL
jgi:two-component system OmpR family sensor kinase